MTTAELSKETGINEESLNSLCKMYAGYMAEGMTIEQAMERTGKVLSVLCDHAQRHTPAWREFSGNLAEETWNKLHQQS